MWKRIKRRVWIENGLHFDYEGSRRLRRAAPTILRKTFLAIITLGAWLRPHRRINLAKLADVR